MKRYLGKTLSDKVFEQLENDIITGKYKPGDMLTEMHLVEEMNISRTPVREALHRLEQEHLVVMTGYGMQVRGIVREDLEDMILIRSRIEGKICRYAAENRNGQQVDRLRQVIADHKVALDNHDPDELKNCDDEFHNLIAEMCGRPLLADTLLPLHHKMARYRRSSVESRDRALESVREHEAISEAIAAGDGDKAEVLAYEHMCHAAVSILGEEGMELCR